MHARSLAVALWRRRWTALGVLALTLVAAGLWLGLAPRSYTAVATVTASPRAGTGNRVDIDGTLAALADSRPVLQDVRDKVGTRRTLAELQDEVRGERVGGTDLIRITVRDADAGFARRVANAIADVLPLHDPTSGAVVFTDAGRATTPRSASSPDAVTVVWSAVGIGVVLAILVALTYELLGGRVERADRLAGLTGAPVLGRLRRPADAATVPALRRGPHADDFRPVRVALEFAGSVAPTRTIVVAPAAPDAAAGWVTVNLAASLAEVQHRVLLIDADFGARPRHPVLAGPGDGLVGVLGGRVDLADAIAATDIPGVSVLPIGDPAVPEAPAWLEMRFHALLGRLTEDQFDVVLVHAAPTSESVEPLVLAVGNSLLLIVPAGRLRAATVRRRVAEVRSVRLRLIGSVLLSRRPNR